MKKLFAITTLLGVCLLAFLSCNDGEYVTVDIPLGAVTLTHKLTPEDLEGTPAGRTKIAFEKEYNLEDDNFLSRLKYYKDQKDITLSITDIRFRADPQGRTQNDATGGIDDVLLVAEADGSEIARFAIDNILQEGLGKPIKGNEEYERFISEFFNAVVVQKKRVALRCSGTIVGFKAGNANVNLADYVFLQDISASIRIKR